MSRLRYNHNYSYQFQGCGGLVALEGRRENRPFPSCCEPHYESEAKCKAFHVKISFVCI